MQLGTTRNYIAVEEKFLGVVLVYDLACTELHSTFYSYNETLIVRFVTDGSVTARGFIARYTVFILGK